MGVVAQAKAGRAWVYLYGALTYGPIYDLAGPNDTPCIPLRTSGDPTVENGPLATTQQLFDQVKTDLDFACAYAPEYSANASRATRAAAYALRAEYHMYTRNWGVDACRHSGGLASGSRIEGIGGQTYLQFQRFLLRAGVRHFSRAGSRPARIHGAAWA